MIWLSISHTSYHIGPLYADMWYLMDILDRVYNKYKLPSCVDITCHTSLGFPSWCIESTCRQDSRAPAVKTSWCVHVRRIISTHSRCLYIYPYPYQGISQRSKSEDVNTVESCLESMWNKESENNNYKA